MLREEAGGGRGGGMWRKSGSRNTEEGEREREVVVAEGGRVPGRSRGRVTDNGT